MSSMHSLNRHPNQGEQCFRFEVIRLNPQGEVVHRGQASATCRCLDLGQGLLGSE